MTEGDKTSALGRVVHADARGRATKCISCLALSYLNSSSSPTVSCWSRRTGTRGCRARAGEGRGGARRFSDSFPDRRVVQIHPLAINWDGGGMHCITQRNEAE